VAASYAGPVTILLRLLDEVSYDGRPVAGARPGDLLAALAQQRSGVPDRRLVDEVWGDDPPAVPGKALQVLVSRLRTHIGADAVTRYDGGYRLTLADDAVDAWVLQRLVADAAQALAGGDAGEALVWAEAAAGLVALVGAAGGDGPLGSLRRWAEGQAPPLARLRGLALSRSGQDAAAVDVLRDVHAFDSADVEVLEALLRSEATGVGVPAALERYDAYRRHLADRLGVDPDAALQRVHRELLAGDEPVRTGVRYDADELLGRDADLAGLRALVRTGRLTTILGPGGLGKTRTAHVLAREATQPRVHFVELVGISASEDVVSEVGSALGVRNSVTGRRTLTPGQLADVRGRIAQELDTVPTLLVLDNCEHVLDAVASLVAFLLATTRDLRVVTTSRAPLGIAAERVFLLSQLAAEDGAELFRRRAHAVRPDADLPHAAVAEVVARLDGLPLALELAAARIRTMSVDEVRVALADRFSLLRGRDRSAPARHQTLTAVIGWSWDLLSAAEQRALAWLSVYHDGFSVDVARAQLGHDGPDLVDALATQSMLSVSEQEGVSRYRMLETVREFGLLRLAAAGEVPEARAAQTRWAVDLCERWNDDVYGSGQINAMDHLWPEEGNLADVLRRALTDGDVAAAIRLLSTLGSVWAVTGNHPRIFSIAELARRLFLEHEPAPELAPVAADALSLLLIYADFIGTGTDPSLVAVLEHLGPPVAPWSRVVYTMFIEAEDPEQRIPVLMKLAGSAEPDTALAALQWAAVLAENDGELTDAASYVDRALEQMNDETTPWQVATLHTQKAYLALQRGDHREAARHAVLAVPVLNRLRATDDALQAQGCVVLAAILDRDLTRAEDNLREMESAPRSSLFGSAGMTLGARAELALARGDRESALAAYDAAATEMRAMRFPGAELTGNEPWVVLAESTALTAFVRFATRPEQVRRRDELGRDLLESVRRQFGTEAPVGHGMDYPVTGMALAATGVRLLDAETDPEAGVRLLALARSFGYNQTYPVMAWSELRALADAAAPGRLDAVLGEYDGRRGRDLRDEVRRVLALTSSG
jgi:predicted ATPase/DNA-binding SARP family transcriptional activator